MIENYKCSLVRPAGFEPMGPSDSQPSDRGSNPGSAATPIKLLFPKKSFVAWFLPLII
jgi:hypothetical protein